jgi:hypothetical protein
MLNGLVGGDLALAIALVSRWVGAAMACAKCGWHYSVPRHCAKRLCLRSGGLPKPRAVPRNKTQNEDKN